VNKLIFKDKAIRELFSVDDPFEFARTIDGKIYRESANRTTKQFFHDGESYFIKYHGGIGWREIFKNISKLQLPTIGALREWNAINHLNRAEIKCPEQIAFGYKGLNPANSKSFIITKALKNSISLEESLKDGKFQALPVSTKIKIINQVADICRKMHESGMNHRDLYLCHFHINEEMRLEEGIYIIDLHRAQIRKKVPRRWLEKDIGGLLHSSLGYNFGEKELYRFLEVYFLMSTKELTIKNKDFLFRCINRAFSMYLKPKIQACSFKVSKNAENFGFIKKFYSSSRAIYQKKYFTKDLELLILNLEKVMKSGKVIKKEAGHFIIHTEFNNKRIYIKKYQIKNTFHYIRRLCFKTRALNAWQAIQWYRAAGIRTIEPLCIVENFNFLSSTSSYLVTYQNKGSRLDKLQINDENGLKIASSIGSFFRRLSWIRFNHGDVKSSNFHYGDGKLTVFDLDIAKRYLTNFAFLRKRKKDIKRILKSFKSEKKFISLLENRIK
tara:strand:+ start:27254 stop:28747 length:1494 start_codon:yes stop_codon:yes gene_type:complete